MTQEKIESFIKNYPLTIISTTGKDYPESAVIGFASDGLVLTFNTNITSRKYQNLIQNPRASFVIGWDENKTVQYEGEVTELEGDELTQYKEVYFEKKPEARQWGNADNLRYFKVIPKWMRYTNITVHPWEVEEFHF
jgi:uncharacterized pyridoxamine 5'-phosphate oxidase family protein